MPHFKAESTHIRNQTMGSRRRKAERKRSMMGVVVALNYRRLKWRNRVSWKKSNCTWRRHSGSEWGSAARSVRHYGSEQKSAAHGLF